MNLTPSELHLKRLLQVWVLLFGLAAFVFYFFGHPLFRFMNDFSFHLFPSLKAIAIPTEKFWLSLAMSLMITLVFLCYTAQKDIRKELNLVVVLLISKFSSTLFFFIAFVTDERLGAYLVGLFTDGGIFLITYLFYQRVFREKTASA